MLAFREQTLEVRLYVLVGREVNLVLKDPLLQVRLDETILEHVLLPLGIVEVILGFSHHRPFIASVALLVIEN